MSYPPSALSGPADPSWLIENLTRQVPDIAHAILVSADGLPLARSAGFPTDRADVLFVGLENRHFPIVENPLLAC